MKNALSILLAVSLAGVTACGGDDTTGNATTGTGTATTGAGGGGGAGGKDVGPAPASATGTGGSVELNGCTSYTDHTADEAIIKWDLNVSGDPNRCSRVKKGAVVRFEGNFTSHPLAAKGGDSPSPFEGTSPSNPGTAEEFTAVSFENTGTFGYVCAIHPSMTGAIEVVD